MNRKLIGALLLALAGSFGGAASAAVIYDENDSSDVTGIHPGVDLGTLALGTSTVVGTLPGDFDADWFQFTIGVGMQLDDILIAAFTGPGGNVSFVGGTFTIFDVVNVGVNGNSIGVDILDIAGPASTLAPGTYSVKVGTGTNMNTYALDFVVSSVGQVPEPASLALLGIGIAGLAAARRRKQMA
jgi:hypothetical protein